MNEGTVLPTKDTGQTYIRHESPSSLEISQDSVLSVCIFTSHFPVPSSQTAARSDSKGISVQSLKYIYIIWGTPFYPGWAPNAEEGQSAFNFQAHSFIYFFFPKKIKIKRFRRHSFPRQNHIHNFDFQISNFKNLKYKNSNNWKKEKITFDLLGNVTCPIGTHHVSKRLWAAENDRGKSTKPALYSCCCFTIPI